MIFVSYAGEVEGLVAMLPAWAALRDDVRAIALVGSWAYGRPRADSDVDLVLLTEAPGRYIDSEDWLADLGGTRLIRTQQWGLSTERRFTLANGPEVELGVVQPVWACVHPLDAGTRRIVTDGMRVVYDPDGLLAELQRACRHPR